jgi:transketolase|tara:strand:+ start:6065 stop:6865 length:801 start_codon:yes stop_codon:yes gene_type:complete
MRNKQKKIQIASNKMRRAILETSFNCGASAHIGGALSMVEILACLYQGVLNTKGKNRDIFILSKGHGFLALLSALYIKKFISKKKLMTFQSNGSEIIAHPIMDPKIGIESSNGSLGQGLSFSIGLALAKKKKKYKGNIFSILGDGECYEGSVWESAISATELNLDNLTIVIDCNGFQNDGKIGSKMNYKDIFKKWKGFGWNTILCEGHDIAKILKALKSKKKNVPTAIIAKTVKGKGVSFMENNNDWHHGRLTKKLYKEAIKELKT